jgi:hypothetical protein
MHKKDSVMNFKKILIVTLICFTIYQTSKSDTRQDTFLSSFDGKPKIYSQLYANQQLYSFNPLGLNDSTGIFATFIETTNTVTAVNGLFGVIMENTFYNLTSDTSQKFLGYVEAQYVTLNQYEAAAKLVISSSLISPAHDFYTLFSTGAWVQTYPTQEGGYLQPIGTNKAGQQNGKITVDGVPMLNCTIYVPLYGIAA